MPDDKPGQQPGGGAGDPPAGNPPKTADERLAAMEAQTAELQKQNQTALEELKRVQNLNRVLMDRMNNAPRNDGRGMNVQDTVPMNPDGTPKLKRDFKTIDPVAQPDVYARELISEAVEQVTTQYAGLQARNQQMVDLKAQFYKSHSDLIGFEMIVSGIAAEVAQQNPYMTTQEAFDETAKRTRNYLKDKGLSKPNETPNPPAHLPGGPSGEKAPLAAPKGDEPYDEAQARADSMKDFMDERSRDMNRVIGGGAKS